ncbi:MAG: polysaccharide biosynthesis tyrosine autokinase [Candidatus Omnitrophica bacterium]|nr:polysaccharide biosynthesis tyrosine autokinase [Candidatus Omnitrophota bacterium]
MLSRDEAPKTDFSIDDAEGGNLQDFWGIILSHLRLVIGITAAGMVLATVYYHFVPNQYLTSAKILIEKTADQQKSYQDMIVPQVRGEEDYYGTQISILTGQPMRTRVEAEIGAPEKLYLLQAKRLRNTRIVQLSVTYGDPVMAAKIANAFADVFVRESAKQSSFMSRQILQLIPDENEAAGAAGGAATGFNKEEFVGSFSGVSNDPDLEKLKNEKLELESRLRELSQRYLPQHPSVREVSERLTSVENGIRERTRKIVSNLRASLAGDVNITNVRVLEEAPVPLKPSKPNRVLGVFFATVMSFLGSSFLVIAMDYTSQKIVTEEHLRKYLGLPFLGHVPVVKELYKNKKLRARSSEKLMSVVDALTADSRLSDAVASVRTHILFSMPYEKSRRIMFTSCIPDEGKSTVGALLAASLTSLGQKILLIDADLRRPFLHTHLAVKNQKGLTDFLVGNATIEEVIVSLDNTPLKLVTGGTISPNPSELLASDRFADFLAQASERFERILIDAPPVLYIPDGLIVAKQAHSSILVCGSGMVDRQIARSVKEKFEAVGHPLIGVVINRMNYEGEGYKYKHYGSYKKYYAGKT